MQSRFPAIAAAALLSASPALAQIPVGKEPVPSILLWTPKQQLERYPAIEKTFVVNTIRKGDHVRELAPGLPINPAITLGGRTSDIDAFMKRWRITGVIVVKDGKVALEKYGLGRTADQRWTSFSVTKSVTSTLIGAAVKDGYIRSIYDPIAYYIPELKGSAYDGVSLRQVMTMTSGVKWNENYTDPASDVWHAGFGPFKPGESPLVEYMRRLPREAPPGARFAYKTGETDLAAIALLRALAGKSLAEYASEKLWAPYGMEQDAIWMVDKAGAERGGCCMSMTLRDYARIGLFMLDGGKIDGKDILPPNWVAEATSNQAPQKSEAQYGYFWWPSREAPNYTAQGIFGQGIAVYPEENLVIALNSAMLKPSDRRQTEAQITLVETLRAATKAVQTAANGHGRLN